MAGSTELTKEQIRKKLTDWRAEITAEPEGVGEAFDQLLGIAEDLYQRAFQEPCLQFSNSSSETSGRSSGL